ncbi:hypothetical protein FZEAL_9077 [Fusarium zealandicum]|uniref:Monooxygenase n=1 Tax=Fusarium zealandicum TaxID=1053134 RepID=A0A8H4XH79_9HYPO|nr:hypothetical protein FZEAL_9077 [Fusarium zealandicum]
MDTSRIHVAVIGAGPAGLTAIKSLLEEGFQVTCFERRPDAGGIWAFSDNPQYTSVTKGTRAQLSKFLLPFSDYPVPDVFPIHPNAEHLVKYYQSYATHFGLVERIVFNASVSSITRTKDDTQWALHLADEESPRLFDKIVVASGSEVTPILPVIEGLDVFEGQFIHSQSYKRAEDFAGKNVVVIGQGNTAGDCAVELSSQASKVYWSHRRGAMVFPRMLNGQRFDAFASWKKTRTGFWVAKHLPSVHRWIFDGFFSWIVWKAWGKLDPQWRLDRNAYYATTISGMVVNDHLVPALRAGDVTSTAGVKRILGPRSVELDDGIILDNVDAIIACTGYNNSLRVLDGIVNYSRPHADARPIPDLYQGIFPLGHTDSIACLNYVIVMDSAATAREVAAMAVAEIWAGKSALPPTSAMETWVRKHQAWFTKLCLSNPLPQYDGQIEAHGWFKFVNEMAGTGVYEHLGWTVKGIRFWLREPKLCSMMAWGVNTPHIYRVFETGKRKAWDGARDEIRHVNELSDIDLGPTPPPKSFIPFELFNNRTVLVACLLGGNMWISFYCYELQFSSYLQVLYNLSVSKTGYITNIYNIVSCGWAIPVGLLLRLTDRCKWQGLAMLLIHILATGLMIKFRMPDTSIAIMASVPHRDVAVGLAILNLVTSVGGAIDQSISGAIWTNLMPSKLAEYLPEELQADALLICGDLTQQLAFPWGSPEGEAIVRTYGEMQKVMTITSLAALAKPIAWILLMKNHRLSEREQTMGLLF